MQWGEKIAVNDTGRRHSSVPLRVSLGLSHPHAVAQSTHRVDTATLKNLSDWMSKDKEESLKASLF